MYIYIYMIMYLHVNMYSAKNSSSKHIFSSCTASSYCSSVMAAVTTSVHTAEHSEMPVRCDAQMKSNLTDIMSVYFLHRYVHIFS